MTQRTFDKLAEIGSLHNVMINNRAAQRIRGMDIDRFYPGQVTFLMDKTGVITAQQADVGVFYINDQIFTPPHCIEGWSQIGDKWTYLNHDIAFDLLLKCMVLLNDAVIEKDDVNISSIQSQDFNCQGTACDAAMLRMAENTPTLQRMKQDDALRIHDNSVNHHHSDCIFGVEHMKALYPKTDGDHSTIPFTGTYKYQAGVFHSTMSPENNIVLMKGSPELVMMRCSSMLINGVLVELDDGAKNNIYQVLDNLGYEGYRCLGCAYRDLSEHIRPEGGYKGGYDDCANYPTGKYHYRREGNNLMCPENEEDDSLVFLGVIGLTNLPKPSAVDFVAHNKELGNKVHMVTGDHPATAGAVAKLVGLFSDTCLDQHRSTLAYASEACRSFSMLANLFHENDEVVLARASRENKSQIAECHMQMNLEEPHVVVFIGNGENDSDAMLVVDISIAMGSGEKEARDVADMVLLDDDLNSLKNFFSELHRIAELPPPTENDACCSCS
jgi:magnesium-transporting ATPase (P-type)